MAKKICLHCNGPLVIKSRIKNEAFGWKLMSRFLSCLKSRTTAYQLKRVAGFSFALIVTLHSNARKIVTLNATCSRIKFKSAYSATPITQ